MKLAKFLWTIASFYLLIIVFVYIVILKDAPEEGLERYEFILENWSIYNYQWKAELLMTTFLSISSFLFFKYTKNPCITAAKINIVMNNSIIYHIQLHHLIGIQRK